MLNSTAFWTTIPVKDIDRAKQFYEETLGLKYASSLAGTEMFDCGQGTRIILYTPRETITEWGKITAGVFMVEDLEATMRELKGKGVQFDDFDFPDYATDENQMVEEDGGKAAWFKDSEGNTLCVAEFA